MWIEQFSVVALFHVTIQGFRFLPCSDAAVLNIYSPGSIKRGRESVGSSAGDFRVMCKKGAMSLLPTFFWPELSHIPHHECKGGWEM